MFNLKPDSYKKSVNLSTIILLISTSLFAQIQMNSSGEVGIGTSPVSGVDFYTPHVKTNSLDLNDCDITVYKSYQGSSSITFDFSYGGDFKIENGPTQYVKFFTNKSYSQVSG